MNRNEPHEPQRFKSMGLIETAYECPACGSLLSRLQEKCDMCKQVIDWSIEKELDRRTYEEITDDGEW